MSVNFAPKSTGNREKNSVFPMPAPIPQPVLDTSTNTMTSNVYFCSLNKKGPHAAQQATPDFMPKGCVVPESGSDIADPKAGDGAWGYGTRLGTPPDANR